MVNSCRMSSLLSIHHSEVLQIYPINYSFRRVNPKDFKNSLFCLVEETERLGFTVVVVPFESNTELIFSTNVWGFLFTLIL